MAKEQKDIGVRSSLDRSHRRPVRLDLSRREIHAAVGVHEYTLQSVAEFLELHYSTISMIVKRVTADCGPHK